MAPTDGEQPPAAGIPPSLLDQVTPFPTKEAASSSSSPATLPLKPPAMANAHQYTADEIHAMLNRTPLFMTELDETDGAGGVNLELEALRALAYEGTRAEVAGNFREQGNEAARAKRWADAREYYSKGLEALGGGSGGSGGGGGGAEGAWDDGGARGDGEEGEEKGRTFVQHGGEEEEGGDKVVDLEEEERKEKAIREACLVNRALCNLEMKNYGSTNRDCAAAITLNPRNVKAYYRSAQACLALGKLRAAADACSYCLALDEPGSTNAAAAALRSRIAAEQKLADGREAARVAREREAREQAAALKTAVAARGYRVVWSSSEKQRRPDTEDAKLALEDPLDAGSVMSVPVLILYPTAGQSDLVKAARETETLGAHLEYLLPCPWDDGGGGGGGGGEFGGGDGKKVDCFADTVDGGMIKVGKNLMIGQVLSGGKAKIEDGLWTVYVVPRSKVPAWVEQMKQRKSR